jgi:hypothetical protein
MSFVPPVASPFDELIWLKNNPHFEQRPATLTEFLGPDYLNIESKVRARIKIELEQIMGSTVNSLRPTAYPYAMITGGIGIGKTTVASIVLPYLAHWVLCLKDPQDFYGMLPGSRIAFMQMSTSEKQALEVVFGDIKARINNSPWFKNYPYDPSFKNQLRFPKDVWIIPGDSSETTFEGYNILGGILDEADSHRVTERKDYAEQGFTTIDSRVTSRFQDRGFLLVIGQMKKATGFAAKKFKEFSERPDAYAVRLTIWESMGKDFYKDAQGNYDFFYYNTLHKKVVSRKLVEAGLAQLGTTMIEVPALYLPQFKNAPEKAMRDLAGLPPVVGDPFISLVDRLESARDRWKDRFGPISPVDPVGRMETWFRCTTPLQRVIHVDIGYSANGDAMGIAMGHVSHTVEVDGEPKPYIVIDMAMRLKAPPGGEIFLGDMRQIIYTLRDKLKFKIAKVTMDGFQSTDTMQQLERRRFKAEYLSIDRSKLPYEDLREALYESRVEFPPLITKASLEVDSLEEVIIRELSELSDTGHKIDHPPEGTKDVADCIAGVVTTLMSETRLHHRVIDLSQPGRVVQTRRGAHRGQHPAVNQAPLARAPIPPSLRKGF